MKPKTEENHEIECTVRTFFAANEDDADGVIDIINTKLGHDGDVELITHEKRAKQVRAIEAGRVSHMFTVNEMIRVREGWGLIAAKHIRNGGVLVALTVNDTPEVAARLAEVTSETGEFTCKPLGSVALATS